VASNAAAQLPERGLCGRSDLGKLYSSIRSLILPTKVATSCALRLSSNSTASAPARYGVIFEMSFVGGCFDFEDHNFIAATVSMNLSTFSCFFVNTRR
jgi:hypothetical protein